MALIRRQIEPLLHRYASLFRVVTLTGPRQTGKTTLTRMAFPEKRYLSLEDPDVQRLAMTDPRALLDNALQGGRGIVLDEVQRVPDLLSYIQGIVDRDQVPGQFILTGSQNFALLEKVTQTLAGRSGILHLLPLSCDERASSPAWTGRMDTEVVTGGYPSLLSWPDQPALWLKSYVETYVERDVRQLLNVSDLNTFRTFVRLCAGRVGQLLDLASLGADCGVALNTAKRWISVLETSYLVGRLRPLHTSFGKRLIKTPKLYFTDSGVVSTLLGLESADALLYSAQRGHVFESWVYGELLKAFHNAGRTPTLSFWRDREGLEIDFMIEQPDGLVAIEAKSGQTFTDSFLDSLRNIQRIAGQAVKRRFLIYGGAERYEIDGIVVLPWRAVNEVLGSRA